MSDETDKFTDKRNITESDEETESHIDIFDLNFIDHRVFDKLKLW